MLVLGLDTATPATSVALVRVGAALEVLAERVQVDPRRHGELLAVGIREVLAQAAGERLGAVVVGLGPGPYTGLRVGIVTALALADAWGVPAYGTCSLDGLGSGARVAVTDARRREVYWARYGPDGARLAGPAVDLPAVLVEQLAGAPPVGDGALLYPAAFGPVPEQPRYPSPARLVEVLASRIGDPPVPLVPLYLRRPDAQVPGAGKRVTA